MGIQALLQKAKDAKPALAGYSEEKRNTILHAMADKLEKEQQAILAANAKDIMNAEGNMPPAMVDRLRLSPARIAGMSAGIREVAALPCPLQKADSETTRPNGLVIRKVRVPLGVVAIVYESRPNVTADVAALCLKSGNVCVLRGGSDAIHSNTTIVQALRAATKAAGGNEEGIQFIEDTSRETVTELMRARGFVDVLIPRGGKGLIAACVEGARGVPVIETGTGICHIYVDKAADLDMAVSILYNAKTSRPSVCNAAEVCLVHAGIAEQFLPLAEKALKQSDVQLRLDDRAAAIIPGEKAGEQDFDTEFLDYILAVAVVGSLDDALTHIARHSTGHSEAIVTADSAAAARFLQEVDSAAVYHNASTRFTDGGEFGLGCEMGISTQKLGARGPMGLYELTSYQYRIQGTGQIRG